MDDNGFSNETDPWKVLATINDHMYQREWLLEHVEQINDAIRRYIHKDQTYHYAVTTLIDILPVMMTGDLFKAWWERLIDSLYYAQELQDRDLVGRLTVALARFHNVDSDVWEAEKRAREAKTHVKGRNEETLLHAYAALIEAHILSPIVKFEPKEFDEALEIAQRSEDKALTALIYQMLAVAYLHQHKLEAAQTHAMMALNLAEELRDQNTLFRSYLINASLTRNAGGDWAVVRENLQRARDLFPHTLQTARNHMLLHYEEAMYAHEMDNSQEAVRLLLEGMTKARGREHTYEVGLCYVGLALSYLKLERYDEAGSAIEEAQFIWEDMGNFYMNTHAIYTRAFIELKRCTDLALARNLFVEAMQSANQIAHQIAREQMTGLIQEKIDLLDTDNAPCG